MEQAAYPVALKPDRGAGYVPVVPEFPGCYSQGDTTDEALSNAREAILLTIEDMRKRGDRIADPAGERVRLHHTGVRPKSDEFSAEWDPVGWKGEGWS